MTPRFGRRDLAGFAASATLVGPTLASCDAVTREDFSDLENVEKLKGGWRYSLLWGDQNRPTVGGDKVGASYNRKD